VLRQGLRRFSTRALLLCKINKSSPEVLLKNLRIAEPRRFDFPCTDCHGLAPIIRFRHDVEFRGNGRIANAPKFHFEAEKIELVIRNLVEPVKGGPVFLSKLTG